MSRTLECAIAVALALSLPACDAPTSSTSLDVDLSAATAVAEASSGVSYTIEGDENEDDQIVEYPWRTSFVVTALETGGVPVNVTSVSLSVRQASGGIIIAPSGGKTERYEFDSSATTNRLEANETVQIAFQVWYELPNGGHEALVTVTMGFRDDDGRTYTGSVEAIVS
jgi:hypothetical protein